MNYLSSLVSLWLKNPFNQRNPRLKVRPKGLHSFAFSLTSYGISSTIEQVRKNNLFMQNKANFQKVKFNVNNVLTRDYDQLDTWSIRKTKPIQSQLKPIKANSKPIKANIMPKQTQLVLRSLAPKTRRFDCCLALHLPAAILLIISFVFYRIWIYSRF
jgi:hypothetical protein